jgi:hypothetical protein
MVEQMIQESTKIKTRFARSAKIVQESTKRQGTTLVVP